MQSPRDPHWVELSACILTRPQTFRNLYGRQSGLKIVIISLGFKSNQGSSQCTGEPEHNAQQCPQDHNRTGRKKLSSPSFALSFKRQSHLTLQCLGSWKMCLTTLGPEFPLLQALPVPQVCPPPPHKKPPKVLHTHRSAE